MNTNEHIKDLEATRQQLVEKRRERAHVKDDLEVKSLQERIEAVDRALTDERKLMGPPQAQFTTQV